MSDKQRIVTLTVVIKKQEEAQELLRMFNAIMYTIESDPTFGDKTISTSINTFDADEELYYDDETLDKVRDAIGETVMIGDQAVIEVITAIQNAGVLFRERSKG